MTYYFNFGYHSPEDWLAFSADPSFDCESTGLIQIEAEGAAAAESWGTKVAAWYLERLHGTKSSYSWSPDEYANWLATKLEDTESGWVPVAVKDGELPKFVDLRESLRD